jgi:hypothetical protein
MKQLIVAGVFALLAGTTIYCSDAVSSEVRSGGADAALANNQLTFKVNGALVKTSGWNISRFTMGQSISLNITSNMHEDQRTVLFNIQGDQPGAYSLASGARTAGSAYGHYKPDYNDMLNAFNFKSGSIVISSIDTVKGVLNASFEGVAINTNGQQFTITEGKIINGTLKPGIMYY